VALRLFLDINGWRFDPTPDNDEAESAVLAVAAGECDEVATAEWLRSRLTVSLIARAGS
jgi:prophage maintenance system killer protein